MPAHLTKETEYGSLPRIPTPTMFDYNTAVLDRTIPGSKTYRGNLKEWVQMKHWPTPSATPRGAHTGELAGSVSPDGMSRVSAGGTRFGATLETAVANSMKRFATPQARDFRTGQESRWDNLDRSRNLNDQIAKWPTPTVNDSKNSTLPPSQITHDNIPGQMLRQGEVAGGQLNSDWVEWLMGWPIGWTDLKPLAMDRFHQWLLSHGKF